MKLFYSKGACSLVIRIILNELGIKADYESVDLKAKKTASGEDFYSINPKGAVPTLQTNDGEILTENVAILQYLADTNNAYQLLPALGDMARYRVLERLIFITTELHKNFGSMFNSSIPADLKKDIFIPLLKNKFKLVNDPLQHQKYLVGNNFTLPDAYLFVMLLWARNLKINLEHLSNTSEYFTRLKQRPSIKKSLIDEGIHLED